MNEMGERMDIDTDDLNAMFARIPPGPYLAAQHGNAHSSNWEVRAINTDPTNRHHWPYRLCESIQGQKATCDADVFGFIAGVINAWPWICAAIRGSFSADEQAIYEMLKGYGVYDHLDGAAEYLDNDISLADDLKSWVKETSADYERRIADLTAEVGVWRVRAEERDGWLEKAIKRAGEAADERDAARTVGQHWLATAEEMDATWRASADRLTAERDEALTDAAGWKKIYTQTTEIALEWMARFDAANDRALAAEAALHSREQEPTR